MDRKSPILPAKQFKLKITKKGLDGKMWIVYKRSDGVKAWKRKNNNKKGGNPLTPPENYNKKWGKLNLETNLENDKNSGTIITRVQKNSINHNNFIRYVNIDKYGKKKYITNDNYRFNNYNEAINHINNLFMNNKLNFNKIINKKIKKINRNGKAVYITPNFNEFNSINEIKTYIINKMYNSQNYISNDIKNIKLSKDINLSISNITNNSTKFKNIYSTSLFIPKELTLTEKSYFYLQGFIKLVETFKVRTNWDAFGDIKDENKWGLYIYIDNSIIYTDMNDSKYKKANNNNNINKKIKNNYSKNFNDLLMIKYIYHQYINQIIDNPEKYSFLKIFSCEISGILRNNYVGYPNTLSSILRFIPLYYNKYVENVFLINGSRGISNNMVHLVNYYEKNKNIKLAFGVYDWRNIFSLIHDFRKEFTVDFCNQRPVASLFLVNKSIIPSVNIFTEYLPKLIEKYNDKKHHCNLFKYGIDEILLYLFFKKEIDSIQVDNPIRKIKNNILLIFFSNQKQYISYKSLKNYIKNKPYILSNKNNILLTFIQANFDKHSLLSKQFIMLHYNNDYIDKLNNYYIYDPNHIEKYLFQNILNNFDEYKPLVLFSNKVAPFWIDPSISSPSKKHTHILSDFYTLMELDVSNKSKLFTDDFEEFINGIIENIINYYNSEIEVISTPIPIL